MPSTLTPWAFVLAVPDLTRSADYFRDILGFRLLWEDGADWRLAERNGMRIMIGHCPDDMRPADLGSHSWFGYVNTDDVEGLYAEFTSKGAVVTPPFVQPYGMREIVVTTVDGHRIVFGEQYG